MLNKIRNCRSFSDGFLVCFLKLIHFHVCAFGDEIDNKTFFTYLFISSFICMDIDICPLLESDMIIPLYTNSSKQSFFVFFSIFHKLILDGVPRFIHFVLVINNFQNIIFFERSKPASICHC